MSKKEEFSAAFQKLYGSAKSMYICQWSLFWFKKMYVSPIFKKSLLNVWTKLCIYMDIYTTCTLHTHIHKSEYMKLLLTMVFEVLPTIKNSGSPMKCPFESLTPTCETKRCNNGKDKSVVICDVCGYLIKYKWNVLMHNYVRIIE
jgi:hypothetical protein